MNGRLYMCKRYQFRLYDFSDYILVWYLIFILLTIVDVEREAGASEENPSTCYNSLTNLHKAISSTPRHGYYYPHKNIGRDMQDVVIMRLYGYMDTNTINKAIPSHERLC